MEFLKKIKDREAQGVTEYLLMLAAVLIIVAVAVYFVMGTSVSFMITPAAGYPKTTDGDTVAFVPDTITPENIDVSATVHKPDGTDITSSVSGATNLSSGQTLTVNCSEDVPADSELRITYKGSTKIFTISVS